MTARTPSSPSPPPEAPIASAPGPRATALQKVFAAALTASIKTNSYANFGSCFPTPARHVPQALEDAWMQVNTRLEQESTRQFEQILNDRRVIEGLNQWEILIEEARKRKDRAVQGEMPSTPIHTLSADDLYTAHLTPYLQKATEEFDARIHKTQRENALVVDRINEQRAEIELLLTGLEHSVKDIEGSVHAMNSSQQTGLEDLGNDSWEMEQEVAAGR